jgi:glycosyltransferase involved in cell wall biosynthesis
MEELGHSPAVSPWLATPPRSVRCSSMTVYIDRRWSGQHGIARYAMEITGRLPWQGSIRSKRVRPASPLDPFWLSYALKRKRATLYFSPGYNVAASRVPQLVVLHDLIHLQVPGESTAMKRAYYERLVRPAVLRTGAVVTVSEFSKSIIVEWCGIDPGKVTVAPGALSSAFLTPESSTGRSPASHDRRPYVLYVGNGKPHKNIGLLFDAMSALPELRLVCVGLTVHDVQRQTTTPGTAVTLLSGVTDEALAVLYRGAACLALPSLHEGFGLPALEALSQATPVAYLCDAVRETVGPGCGVQGDLAGDAGDFAKCIRRAIELGTHPAFASRATDRLSAYSWEESAARITTAIERVANGGEASRGRI